MKSFIKFGTSIILLISLLLCCSPDPGHSAKILALFPFPGKSHSIMLNRILTELLNRGHELDVVSGFPLQPQPNYTSYAVTPHVDFWTAVTRALNLPGVFEMHDMSDAQTEQFLHIVAASTTEYALRHPNVQRLIRQHSGDQRRPYDVILVEQFFQEAFLMLAHQFDAPVVAVCTFGSASYFDDMFGTFGAWSHVPHEYTPLPERMTFAERLRNVHRNVLDRWQRWFRYMPMQQALADRYFAHLPEPRPTLHQLEQRVAVMLQNSHAPLAPNRALLPNVVNVGGLHIDDARPLPPHIQRFLDAATDGVVFFSFGTQVPSAQMPDAQLQAFLRTFRRLDKLRFVWKREKLTENNSSNVVDFPENVLMEKWMPQNDVLAHPNVRVFITHGGLLGTQEAVWHGVPMLGIPFYTDQHVNTKKAHNTGSAIALPFGNVTERSLVWALTELLDNPAYARRAAQMSRIFRDRPEPAIERAMYWIEYVARFGGAEHLRSAGLELTWASYFLLDVLGALALAVLLAGWLMWWMGKKCMQMVVGWMKPAMERNKKHN